MTKQTQNLQTHVVLFLPLKVAYIVYTHKYFVKNKIERFMFLNTEISRRINFFNWPYVNSTFSCKLYSTILVKWSFQHIEDKSNYTSFELCALSHIWPGHGLKSSHPSVKPYTEGYAWRYICLYLPINIWINLTKLAMPKTVSERWCVPLNGSDTKMSRVCIPLYFEKMNSMYIIKNRGYQRSNIII